MTEKIQGHKSEEISRAQELLQDTDIAWHAVNGFDFGAAISILESGITPSTQFGGKEAISMALSPVDPTHTAHPTFEYYVPKSISFPVPRRGIKVSASDTHDEIQYEGFIPKQDLKGIMIPEHLADVPLSVLPLLKPPSFSKSRAYFDRQINMLAFLDRDLVNNNFLAKIEHSRQSYLENYDNFGARKQQADEINKFFLSQYEGVLGKALGLDKPKLHQVIKYLGERYEQQTLILPEDLKS